MSVDDCVDDCVDDMVVVLELLLLVVFSVLVSLVAAVGIIVLLLMLVLVLLVLLLLLRPILVELVLVLIVVLIILEPLGRWLMSDGNIEGLDFVIYIVGGRCVGNNTLLSLSIIGIIGVKWGGLCNVVGLCIVDVLLLLLL